MMGFQTLLVLGYGYGHAIGNIRRLQTQGRVHATLLVASTVILGYLWLKWGSPLTLAKEWRTASSAHPVAKILELLGVTAGLPFFLLSTTGPLLQKWRTLSDRSPYRLYALSNAGSLLGLISYPFLIEWGLTVKHQAWAWGSSYLAFAILGVAVTWRLGDLDRAHNATQVREEQPEQEAGAKNIARYFLWLGLSACSSIMLLATTNLLCQDIAVIPLLWVVPLALYLLSFILTFAGNHWYRREIFWPLYFGILGGALKISFNQGRSGLTLPIVLCCAVLFIVCMVCHGELARSKPQPRQLTGFYLMVALGGALGGAFVVLIAPNVFLGYWEYKVGLFGCGLLLVCAYAIAKPSQNSKFEIWTIALILLLLCQQVTVIPRLCVVPLVLYLLSSILAFDSNRWHQHKIFWPLYFGALGALFRSAVNEEYGKALWLLALGCIAVHLAVTALRGKLGFWKPKEIRPLGFNVLSVMGGLFGGVAIASLASHLTQGIWGFRIGLLSCCLLLAAAYTVHMPVQDPELKLWTVGLVLLCVSLVKQLGSFMPNFETWHFAFMKFEYYPEALLASVYLIWWVTRKGKREGSEAIGSSPVMAKPVASLLLLGTLLIFVGDLRQMGGSLALFLERNFFGTKSIIDSADKMMLFSGSTLHGIEFKDPARRRTPTSYYAEESGIGRLLRDYPRMQTAGGSLRVGIVGMGAGTLAAYGHPGDIYRFYEIDPAMVELSEGARPYFHFVQDSVAQIGTVLGDARISLENEAARGELQRFDVLALDAFSSDSIPVHLLTTEAMSTYLKHLRGRDSVMAFHITNRYLDLDPVIVALGRAYGLSAIKVQIPTSKWVLLCANPEMFRMPKLEDIATPVRLQKGPVLWTDDYSNLFQVLQRPAL